jgi:hypothetical protein
MLNNRDIMAMVGRQLATSHKKQLRAFEARAPLNGLNPQPLPPIAIGMALANEILNDATNVQQSGSDVSKFEAEVLRICGNEVRDPLIPLFWIFPPVDPPPRPNWLAEFYLGLASGLAVGSSKFESSDLNSTIENVIDHATQMVNRLQSDSDGQVESDVCKRLRQARSELRARIDVINEEISTPDIPSEMRKRLIDLKSELETQLRQYDLAIEECDKPVVPPSN